MESSRQLTKEVRKKIKKAGGVISVYKFGEPSIASPTRWGDSFSYNWRPGVNKAHGSPPCGLDIQGGAFHVYATPRWPRVRYKATKAYRCVTNCRVIRFEARVSDLVGAELINNYTLSGNKPIPTLTLAFRKLTLPEREFKKMGI